MAQRTEFCSRCGKRRGPQDTTHTYYCRECWRTYQRDRYHGRLPALQEATCARCGGSYQQKQRRSSRYCSDECGEAARQASGQRREQYLQRNYGISAAEYDRMLVEQGGGCALCGKKAEEQRRYRKFLHVDHCHDTGKVRGLLCDQHNLLIGRWNHDPALLRRAAAYLESGGPAQVVDDHPVEELESGLAAPLLDPLA